MNGETKPNQPPTLKEQIASLSEKLKKRPWKIGIDGPAAVGKGTLSDLFVTNLNLNKIETGQMYRAITCYFRLKNIEINDLKDSEIQQILKEINIEFKEDLLGGRSVFVSDGQIREDFTQQLENPEIGKVISSIAKRIPVRDKVDQQAIRLLEKGNSIIEGRDMWQVVRKNTDILTYLYASDKVLIQRENESQKKRGVNLSQKEAEEIVVKRNRQDNNRERGKLLTLDEAKKSKLYDVIIDTSNMTPEQIILDVLLAMERKMDKK